MRIQSSHPGKALKLGIMLLGPLWISCLSLNLMLPFCIYETYKVVSPLPLSPLNSNCVLYISSHPICFSTCPKWLANSLFPTLCGLQSDLLYGPRDEVAIKELMSRLCMGQSFEEWVLLKPMTFKISLWYTNIYSDVQLSWPREMSS